MKKRKPTVFVGSSAEGRDLALAIQENLDRDADVSVWTQAIFELSWSTLDSLAKALTAADFGIFVLSADDVLKIRDKEFRTARDNVILELGIFVGGLGIERNFFVVPRDHTLHLPTDLSGITPATFDPERVQINPVAGLGSACNQIRRSMQSRGLMDKQKGQSVSRSQIHEGRVPVAKTVQMMRSAKSQIIITGSSLRSFTGYFERVPTTEFKDVIIELLKCGVHFQFNLLNPDSEVAKIYAKDRREHLVDEIRSSIADLRRFIKEAARYKSHLRMQFYSRLPIGYVLLIDPNAQYGSALVASYFPGTTRADSPYIELYKREHPVAFSKYLHAINELFTVK